MGMTNDNTCEPKSISKEEIVDTLKTMVFGVQAFERFNAKERETLDKAWNIIDQYENRLKADMVAMLTELQLEIEEKEQYYQDKFLESRNAVHDAAMGGRMFGCGECKDIIQQKINEYKSESENI
jgi:hypothetical protein